MSAALARERVRDLRGRGGRALNQRGQKISHFAVVVRCEHARLTAAAMMAVGVSSNYISLGRRRRYRCRHSRHLQGRGLLLGFDRLRRERDKRRCIPPPPSTQPLLSVQWEVSPKVSEQRQNEFSRVKLSFPVTIISRMCFHPVPGKLGTWVALSLMINRSCRLRGRTSSRTWPRECFELASNPFWGFVILL